MRVLSIVHQRDAGPGVFSDALEAHGVEHDEWPIAENEALFKRYDLLDAQVRFLKGWFKDTLAAAPIERLAVLRLDGDLYESTMDALVPLYDKVSGGGFVIVDDYYSCAPCGRAIDEFRATRGISTPLQKIDEQSVFWQKG